MLSIFTRMSENRQHIVSVYSFINYLFFCILKYLNKEESKVIFMREFEISSYTQRRAQR
jgi:hypothetical protein